MRILKYPLTILCYIVLVCLVYNVIVWVRKNFSPKPRLDIPLVHTVGFYPNPTYKTFKVCDNKFLCEFSDVSINGENTLPERGGAYIFYGSGIHLEKLPLPRQYQNIIWSLFHEESPKNLPEASHDEMLSLFNYSCTFSRHSDFPIPLQGLRFGSLNAIVSKQYFVETATKNSLLNEISPIIYLQSNCKCTTERDEYVNKLMEFISVDSYGLCLNNKQLPDKFKVDNLNRLASGEILKFVARYKFVIVIENGVCDDYITEKLWRAIVVGSVPIYFGSPTIRDWLPNEKSAILLEDYPTPELLSEHLYKLMLNDHLYEEYLEHKTKRIISNNILSTELKERPFQTNLIDVLERFKCFICKKLHDMKKKYIKASVNKSHYNCPKPVSALTLKVNPDSMWVDIYEESKRNAKTLYNKMMGG